MNWRSVFSRIALLFCAGVLVQACVADGDSVDSDSGADGMIFAPGVHRLDRIESSRDGFYIKGAGSGITVLEVPGGIFLNGKEPRLDGFTLVGSNNRNTGITLKNSARARLSDIEIQGYELGLLSLCEFGHRCWLHTYRDLYVYEGPGGSQRTYNPRIRGIELRYEGEKKSSGGWKEGGGFSNTHSIYGGRIAVPGVPLLIDGPSATALFGTYIDISVAAPRMTARTPGLQLFGAHLDRSRKARNEDIPALILENPKFNRVKFFGQHINLLHHKLIVDGAGKPVERKHLFISPEHY